MPPTFVDTILSALIVWQPFRLQPAFSRPCGARTLGHHWKSLLKGGCRQDCLPHDKRIPTQVRKYVAPIVELRIPNPVRYSFYGICPVSIRGTYALCVASSLTECYRQLRGAVALLVPQPTCAR